MRKIIFFVLFFIVLILPVVAAGNGCDLSHPVCGSVPSNGCDVRQNTVFAPGVYNLSLGIDVCADNVVLDCNGASLVGSSPAYLTSHSGISLFSGSNVSIINCNLSNYGVGVFGSTGNNLIENNIFDFMDRGVLLYFNAPNNVINGNRFSRIMDMGIYLHRANGSVVSNNNISSYPSSYLSQFATGAFILYTENVLIDNNIFDMRLNGYQGIYQTSYFSDNSTISGNTFMGGFYGVNVDSSNGNIKRNKFLRNIILGLSFSISQNVTVAENLFETNASGIGFGNVGNILVYNNYFNTSMNAFLTTVFPVNWSAGGVNFSAPLRERKRNIVGGPFIAGNYWSDYSGADLDGDGIGDTNLPHYGDVNPLVTTPAIVVDGVPSVNGVINFSLYTKPNKNYVLVLSTGSAPPIVLPDGREINLKADELLNLCIENPSLIGLSNNVNFTDGTGFALSQIVVPNQPGLVNHSFYVGYVTMNSSQWIEEISPSVEVVVL